MLIKLQAFIRRYGLVKPGDRIVCAVSGGADSMALLWAMYLLKDSLKIELDAAHFNHGLRGEESDRDEAFVRKFCEDYQIPLSVGNGAVVPGKKGLEAAAREARYSFLATLSGKIATAHTADDNAETVLMHLVRGTGLKGLGGIAPMNGNLIRPMLSVTRTEVLTFLQEYHIPFVDDSSNAEDAFLRNRLRHHVMPLLKQENPRLAENLSALAQDLRLEEQALSAQIPVDLPDVQTLRAMQPALRRRTLAAFLERSGVTEPERSHVDLVEKLVFSRNPSAKADLPGGVCVARSYGSLEVYTAMESAEDIALKCPGTTEAPEYNLRITCAPTEEIFCKMDRFTVSPMGKLVLRARKTGDQITLKGGTKSLKKLFIDRKIPVKDRNAVPVLADDRGVLAVYGIGASLDRIAPGVAVIWEPLHPEEK